MKIHSICETVSLIQQNSSSLVRFGDGELTIIQGGDIPYQTYDGELAYQLKKILQQPSDKKLLVGIPDVFQNLERYNQDAQNFWYEEREGFKKYLTSNWYVTSFISRPYIDLKNKEGASRSFEKIKSLWAGRELLIVEGKTSRSGVGNDLFGNAKTITRLICPAKNAYNKKNEIFQAIKKYGRGKLILIMLGPTAKVLVSQLSQEKYQALDIGHIDSEYEWFKMNAKRKIKFSHKHTAEHNYDEGIILEYDQSYEESILETII